ncbi:MAG: pyrimidine-nucleoside phosphorylase, partial [Candidatus Acidiferrales bacterium]
TGTRMGKKVVALITDMEQPLGRAIGNALEVRECLDVLNGAGPEDLRELCLELSAWMLVLAGRSKNSLEGRALAAEMIATGRARDTFRQVIRLQGGDAGVVDDPGRLPRAAHLTQVKAQADGYLTKIHCERVGIASMMLGGGREKKEDAIDPAVGLVLEKKAGDSVARGETLCTVHYNLDARLEQAMELLGRSFEIGPQTPEAAPLVRKIIGEVPRA